MRDCKQQGFRALSRLTRRDADMRGDNAMMVLTVLYPATPGARFDWDYYNDAHIPLVRTAFGETGLQDVQVFQGVSSPDGGLPPYVAIANLAFADADAVQASLAGPRAAEVFGDVANYTDIRPVTQLNTIV
jgi:uncharacterized protein (TIGR02118 family)